MPQLRIVLLLLTAALPAVAQQVGDQNFRFEHTNPAYEAGGGPRVCIDEAHHNFHTAGGRYKSFAELLRGDGYTVEPFTKTFTEETLTDCRVLVIANALAEANEDSSKWSYPHPSAFTSDEIRELMLWVRGGGRLLLFADHAPIAGAAAGLGAVFGVLMTDGYARNDYSASAPDLFRPIDGTLKPHPILEGRNPNEQVDEVATFTGQAFHITNLWQPLLVFGPQGEIRINPDQTFQPESQEDWPSASASGLAHGAVREWESGRVAIMGEAAMCSAQVDEDGPMGMNHPRAKQNAQFCLNLVHWLDALLN